MSLIKFSHQSPSLFDRLLENDLFDWTTRNFSETNTTIPSVNIKESHEGFEVEVAAPGFKKEDFKIEQHLDQLTISSHKKLEDELKDANYTRREFSYQSFSRTFSLPNTADNENIAAVYENGILSVKIPKKEEAKPKPARQIAIA